MEKISINLKNVSNEELKNFLQKGQYLDAVIQEVLRRNDTDLFINALVNMHVYSEERLYKGTLNKAISKANGNAEILFDILQTVLLHPETKNKASSVMKMLMKYNEKNQALSLLSANTPIDVTKEIIQEHKLLTFNYLGPKHKLQLPAHAILNHMLSLLKNGFIWGNEESCDTFMFRAYHPVTGVYKNDPFMLMASNHNFSSENFQFLTKIAYDLPRGNPLAENIFENEHPNNLIAEYMNKTNFLGLELPIIEKIFNSDEISAGEKAKLNGYLRSVIGSREFMAFASNEGVQKIAPKIFKYRFLLEGFLDTCKNEPQYVQKHLLHILEEVVDRFFERPEGRQILNQIPINLIHKIPLYENQKEFFGIDQDENQNQNNQIIKEPQEEEENPLEVDLDDILNDKI